MKNCIYVGNLPRESTEARLRSLFEAGGRVVGKVTVAMDKRTGRPRGFGFVEMESDEAAEATLKELAGAQLDGQALKLGTAYRAKKGSGTGRAEYEESYGNWGSQRGGSDRGRGRR